MSWQTEIIRYVTSEFIIPLAGAAISTTVAVLVPQLGLKINKFLSDKLKLQNEAVRKEHEAWLLEQAEHAIRYAEEISRRKVNDLLSSENALSSTEKLNIGRELLIKNTGIAVEQANLLLHSILFRDRKDS